jgi:hypothetical protein
MKSTLIPRTLSLRIASAFLLITAMTLPPGSLEGISITAPAPEASIALSSNLDPVSETVDSAPISYRSYAINRSLSKLKSEIGEEKLAMVLKLNRVDAGHIRTGETLLIPEQVTDMIALSPFPHEVEMARDIPKLFVVSRRVQAFGAY